MTVIGLVLDAKFGKNQSLAEEENESDSENESDDDVDRGYKKSYKYEGTFLLPFYLNELILIQMIGE